MFSHSPNGLPRSTNDSPSNRQANYAPAPDTAPERLTQAEMTFTESEVRLMNTVVVEIMRTMDDDEIEAWLDAQKLRIALDADAVKFLESV